MDVLQKLKIINENAMNSTFTSRFYKMPNFSNPNEGNSQSAKAEGEKRFKEVDWFKP